MIKQQFFLNDKEMLRIYHHGFDDYPKERLLREYASIDENRIEFKEMWIENIQREEILYDTVTNGFLHADHVKNPYGTLCCEYQEFIVYQKNHLIENGQIAQIASFRGICEFVKKWSGFNLKQSPFSIQNVLVFSPTNILLEKNLYPNNERIIELSLQHNGYEELTCVAKFKHHQQIVSTRIVPIKEKHIPIESRYEWSSVDIELYAQDQLVYADYDASFIKSIHIDMGITTKQVDMPLPRAGKSVTLEQVVSEQIRVGESAISKEMQSYQYQEELLKSQINANKRFEFITKGQYERGLDIFTEIAATRGYKELWVFDPYFSTFSTAGGKSRLNDIITVLGKNLNLQKNIVFETNEADCEQTFRDFKAAIHETVHKLKKRDVSMKFTFYGTREHFHDRFIFLKNEHRLQAFLLGTSFNSFGDNYSTIIEMEPLDGRMVFETLVGNLLDPTHLILSEDLS
ncbi:hypothetical protein EJF36_19150 [Bacillus sp. HMF5848]|uniref:VPA1262 family N-terminal domain-containing protein n=1 Tax=Bacillus sp. HMF5848 TaxID=2495421 RepID=UPI000F79B4B3|nr:VPA1262 family N-terminal domain-containing protein [Bacillus sp. HMF5848]RSK28822.1 hypothetical protein EJF36_19150 [Bacillus sp. HMF5848]